MELLAALGLDSRNRLFSNAYNPAPWRADSSRLLSMSPSAHSRRFVVLDRDIANDPPARRNPVFRRMRGSVRQHVRRHCPDMERRRRVAVRRTLRGLTIACDHLQGSPARPAGTLVLMGRVGPSPLRSHACWAGGGALPRTPWKPEPPGSVPAPIADRGGSTKRLPSRSEILQHH